MEFLKRLNSGIVVAENLCTKAISSSRFRKCSVIRTMLRIWVLDIEERAEIPVYRFGRRRTARIWMRRGPAYSTMKTVCQEICGPVD